MVLSSLSSRFASCGSMVRQTRRGRGRQLLLENLESRLLLDVSAVEFAEIRELYPDLNLSAKMSSYNIIEITADNLTHAALQDAIGQAAATKQNDLIVIRTTEATDTITLDGCALSIDITAKQGSITIVSFGDNPLTIDADGNFRVLIIYDNAKSTVALGGLKLINGEYGGIYNGYGNTLTVANSSISDNEDFGIYNCGILTVANSSISDNKNSGIYNCGTLTVADSSIWGNTARYGGGIINAGKLVTVRDSHISGNTADGSGGGIYNEEGKLTVINSSISGNTAVNGDGGGIYNDDNKKNLLTVTNCVFSYNTAKYSGGGIYNEAPASSTVANSSFSDNVATSGAGGGIANGYGKSCKLTVTNATFTNNKADIAGGGGIFNGGTLTVANSIFVLNTAYFGGGICHEGGTTLTVTNSLIAQNNAYYGGGLYVYSGTATVTNATISGNTASIDGGGIWNESDGTMTVSNSIVVENTGADINSNERRIYGYNNLTTFADADWTKGSGNIAYDDGEPLFVSAVSGNYRLADGSQAIDKGGKAAKGLDVAGNPRVVGKKVDIGAYEYQLPVAVTKPKAVAGLQAVKLTWTAAPDAEYYIIECYETKSKTTVPVTPVVGSETSVVIPGLTPGMAYTFTITTVIEGRTGTKTTATVKATTKTMKAVPAPQALKVTFPSPGEIAFTWSAPKVASVPFDLEFKGYKLDMYNADGDFMETIYVGSSTSTGCDCELTTYTVKLYAVYELEGGIEVLSNAVVKKFKTK